MIFENFVPWLAADAFFAKLPRIEPDRVEAILKVETATVYRVVLGAAQEQLGRIGSQICTRFGRERLSETAGVGGSTLRISRLRSSRRWCEDEMPKCQVTFAQTLRSSNAGQLEN